MTGAGRLAGQIEASTWRGKTLVRQQPFARAPHRPVVGQFTMVDARMGGP
jgi:hypothetical protein